MRSSGKSRVTLVATMAALTLGAAAAPSATVNGLFDAMRANRVVPPASAPDVTLSTPDGRAVRLADLRGRVVIVGFFVTG